MIVDILGIRVMGVDKFVSHTREALLLLNTSERFDEIRRYLSIIRQSRRSGVVADFRLPRFEAGEETWNSSTMWYASAIAHDSFHSRLYQEAKVASNGREPAESTWGGDHAERKCMAFQIEILEELNAPCEMVDHVKANYENPQYHKIPYRLRNW